MDRDWYKVNLRKGKTYTFTFSTFSAADVFLHDASGRSLARAHGRRRKPAIVRYRAGMSGAYYLETATTAPVTCTTTTRST